MKKIIDPIYMSNNKTIAKNTLFLYFRMLLVMGVSLYTSRIVLQELGVSDYGIYSLVGGVVALFGFFNAAMSSATQRYLSFDIGKGDAERLKKTFSATLTIHFGIALLVLLLAETLGLWYINHKMVFPVERTFAANMVYQFSIAAALLGIIQVPYNALIIARERMNVYAYVGILEVVLKLIIIFLLVYFGSDKLITYAVLTFVVSLIIRIIYQLYCRKHFVESRYQFECDKPYYKELISYSGWNLFGQTANILSLQGISVLFNLFYGVVINATISVANQVNTAVYGFVSNFQVAFNPQITKTYAKNEIEPHKKLILSTSKFSLIIMTLLASPVLLYTNKFLELWLGNNLPPYSVQFVQIVLLYTLIDALSGPFWTSAYAIGNVKKYNIGISAINLLTLPIIYILLNIGVEPYLAFLSKFFIAIGIQCYRCYYVHSFLKFNFAEFFPYITRVIFILCLNIGVCVLSYEFLHIEFLPFMFGIVLLEVAFLLVILLLILDRQEKSLIVNMFKKVKVDA